MNIDFNDQLWIEFGPVQNPPYEQDGTDFEVTIAQFGDELDYTLRSSVDYPPNDLFSASLTQTNFEVGEISTLTFTFQLNNPLEESGFISVTFPTFPRLVELPTEPNAKMTIYDEEVEISVERDESENGFHFKDLPNAIEVNPLKSIVIVIENVVNPGAIEEISGFDISSRVSTGERINKNENELNLEATLPGAITFTENESANPPTPLYFSNYEINQQGKIEITFNLAHTFEEEGSLVILFPEQFTQYSDSEFECTFEYGWNYFSSGYCTIRSTAGKFEIKTVIAHPFTTRDIRISISGIFISYLINLFRPY